jgi:hypothetical protein
MSVTPARGRLRQEDHEFKTSPGYIARSCLQKKESRRGEKERKKRERGSEREYIYKKDGKGKKKMRILALSSVFRWGIRHVVTHSHLVPRL